MLYYPLGKIGKQSGSRYDCLLIPAWPGRQASSRERMVRPQDPSWLMTLTMHPSFVPSATRAHSACPPASPASSSPAEAWRTLG